MHPPMDKSPALTATAGIHHGFFGRRGGVSEGEFASLNTSSRVGDDKANVADNLHRAVMALKSGPVPVALVNQVHGNAVHVIASKSDIDTRPEADALVTNLSGVALGILTADCAPILLVDPQAGVIGAAHAGWRGAVEGVVAKTVAAMVELGAAPDAIVAAIGPSIAAADYEVGPDFAQTIRTDFPHAKDFLLEVEGSDRPHFDVPGLVTAQAHGLGLAKVEIVGCSTYADPERYFSHRYATHQGARTGRQIALIVRG
jgi:polyphenol oxidase